ncbi:hypothetical protein [Caballeronia insecticola]|uniref:Uncharacterized protein n=1 Tax=Caballeronia insecticola TaxID=758793 RepID=R4WP18_9BURK|nr:hypothetical protein [Caballeronia insecticola]BAN26398.1 hypothetical protein BRPE64_CCDS03150 [Caballeronia insecticola]
MKLIDNVPRSDRKPWRVHLTSVRETWVVAMMQRMCVDMPLLIDSLLMARDHALDERRSEARND